MAGSKTAYLESQLLAHMFGAVAFEPPATYYVALSTAAYTTAATGAAMNEVSAGGYARIAVPNTTANFPAPAGSNPAVSSNAVAMNFPPATAAWGTVLSVYLCDAAVGGNALYGTDLAAGIVMNPGSTLTIPPTALVIQEI